MNATYDKNHSIQIEMTREEATMIDEAMFKMIQCEIEKDPHSPALDRFTKLRNDFNDAIREASAK